MKFTFLKELVAEKQSLVRCCEVLQLRRSHYYAWSKNPKSERQVADENLGEKIRTIWEGSRKTYGVLRIADQLNKAQVKCGKNRVAKIMRKNQIQGVGRKKFKVMTTDSNHNLPIAKRVFQTELAGRQVQRLNQFWAGDITYIPTDEGWLYLAIFMDLFSRKIVGHAMSERMQTELVLSALDMGLKRREIHAVDELVVHTDRGSQYAAEEFRDKLNTSAIEPSMSRKGNCYDNAFAESFFKTLKVELIYRTKLKTRQEAKAAIFEFIEVWYNRQRTHSSLDYQSPNDYEITSTAAA